LFVAFPFNSFQQQCEYSHNYHSLVINRKMKKSIVFKHLLFVELREPIIGKFKH